MTDDSRVFPEISGDVGLRLKQSLGKKKNALRKDLLARGMQKKGSYNKFDNYFYFSEAQYKALFTELFAAHGLELSFSEVSYLPFEGTDKMPFGRTVTLQFGLTDIDTGFTEYTNVTGEGLDKGDKAGYKAYTGALKYYLANTFMVATGDDPERDETAPGTPTAATKKAAPGTRKATPKQIQILAQKYTGDNLSKLLEVNGVERLEDMPLEKASDLIAKLRGVNV